MNGIKRGMIAFPESLALLAMVSNQLGAAIAKSLFNDIDPIGMVCLRTGLGALFLLAFYRPNLRQYSASDYRLLIAFGAVLGALSYCFYAALALLPIGIAVTLEFLGPLGVAIATSRRWLDGIWVLLAGMGIVLLSPLAGGTALNPVGVMMALLAAVFWGTYIVFSNQVGHRFAGGEGLALSLAVASLLLLPLGWAASGSALLQPSVLVVGGVVALLSSVVLYSLEMEALRHLPMTVFGVLMSLEPAIGAVLAFWLLGETLTLQMMAAIALVAIAAAGSSRFKPFKT
ncbi:EamA family transporter [Almyronema epifaneia]|uniref:DMT family transporter n=1 Tax=Almyronema epifaneia S1 TaxID=2991925 RepID=A0ABW6IDT4_9CYAN